MPRLGCPLSPSGLAWEPGDQKARPRPSQCPGSGRCWLSLQRSLAPAPAPPPPRPELGNRPEASLQARRALHVVGRGGALAPTSGLLSPSIPGTESSKAFLILWSVETTVPILLMRRLSRLNSKGFS